MSIEQYVIFGPYRLDPENAQLWRGKRLVRLTGKAFSVLCHLASRPGQLVTKDELLAVVWPEVVVTEAAVTKRIAEIRQALRDNPKAPRYIETVHRQGFRFLGTRDRSQQPSGVSSPPPPPQSSALNPQQPILVGRESELAQLHRWLAKALRGERQVVFVIGEAGIGKTTVVDAFLFGMRNSEKAGVHSPKLHTLSPELSSTPDLSIGHGQCIEQYGQGEAYLPILEALGRMCREPEGRQVIALLRQYAPNWLTQLAAFLNVEEREHLQRETTGATSVRMLREIVEAFEALSAKKPLILQLEDLQWSDYSTVELLAALARRRESSRLLVIGTYRPVDALMREHPLLAMKQELQMHGQCQELTLDFLTEKAVGEYLMSRFGQEMLPESRFHDLAQMIHECTDGNPLFMVTVVNDLVGRGVLVETGGKWTLREEVENVKVGIPDTLRQLIEQQLRSVKPQEKEVLEAASIMGPEFSTAAVAAGMQADVETVEECCDNLVRREQFLRAVNTQEWPDGTVATGYGFRHALYQEVLYERIPAGRRAHLHLRIGRRQEQAFGPGASDIAAELAMHYERGRDYPRAVQYLGQAAQNALQRSANQEAITLLGKGIKLLKSLPDTPERMQREILLHTLQGASLVLTKGWAASEVEQAYTRAHELCRLVGDSPQIFPTLIGLWGFYLNRAQLQTARELGEQLMRYVGPQAEATLRLGAHRAMGVTLYYLGELTSAQAHLEKAIAAYESELHRPRAFLHSVLDPGVVCRSFSALTLWLLGYPDQALAQMAQALSLANRLSHPFSESFALNFAAVLSQFRREQEAALTHAQAAVALSTEQGFGQWRAMGSILQHWALSTQRQEQEDVRRLQQSLTAYEATGAKLGWPYFLGLLAEAQTATSRIAEGQEALDKALHALLPTGECEAEIHRLRGQLVVQSHSLQSAVWNSQHATLNTETEAEKCFLSAIDVARNQRAKSWELRAATSLARLWRQLGKRTEAHKLLSEIYNWFTEGFDTADLKDAQMLLDKLV